MTAPAELVVDARNQVGESPVWCASEQSLYWVDIPRKQIWRWSAAGGTQVWNTQQMAACLAPAAGGTWVCGMETGVFQLSLHASGSTDARPLAGVRHARSSMRFNDGRCDRQGRFRAGTMAFDLQAGSRAGAFYALDGDLSLAPLLDGLLVPNGLAFSPDGRTMYLSDSHPESRLVWAFDYDVVSGRPSRRRVFVDMNHFEGRPDGAAVDQDGCYWTCANDAARLYRFTPDGRLDRTVALPVKKPSMCAFGGSQFDMLYVTSIRPQADVSDQPLAGGVFAVNVGTRGIPETPWTP